VLLEGRPKAGQATANLGRASTKDSDQKIQLAKRRQKIGSGQTAPADKNRDETGARMKITAGKSLGNRLCALSGRKDQQEIVARESKTSATRKKSVARIHKWT
jgi:hypothetical protein